MFKSDYVYPESFNYWNFHSLSALYEFAEHKNNTIIIKSYTNFVLGETYLDESTTGVHFKKVYYIGQTTNSKTILGIPIEFKDKETSYVKFDNLKQNLDKDHSLQLRKKSDVFSNIAIQINADVDFDQQILTYTYF